MFLDLTDEQLALRDELRAYFTGLLSPGERAAMLTERHGGVYREVCAGWAATAGSASAGRPSTVGVAWARWNSRSSSARRPAPTCRCPPSPCRPSARPCRPTAPPEQKEFFLPRILAGEVHFAIGYTEPGAGTDLAALRTRAVRDGDSYLVNGEKIFTTGAHDADYIWLACRTDPDAPRHKGISILIVDTSRPRVLLDADHHARRRPPRQRDLLLRRAGPGRRCGSGEENAGWRLVTTQLNHERVMLGPAGRLAALYDRVLDWAAGDRGPDGRPLLTQPDVRRALAGPAPACGSTSC